MTGTVERGREAFARQAWGDAYALFAASGPLEGDDLERLAVAAHMVGRDDESTRAWERAHLECARLGDTDRAARCAVWLAIGLMLRGDMAQAGGGSLAPAGYWTKVETTASRVAISRCPGSSRRWAAVTQ